jgi:hypothetical protein
MPPEVVIIRLPAAPRGLRNSAIWGRPHRARWKPVLLAVVQDLMSFLLPGASLHNKRYISRGSSADAAVSPIADNRRASAIANEIFSLGLPGSPLQRVIRLP